jgi:hypothetical protein
MEDIMNLFRETNESFTVYVVEQRFVVGRGFEYFRQFRGKENLIIDDRSIKNRIGKILRWSQRKIPNVSELVTKCFVAYSVKSIVSIVDVVTAFSKLFNVNQHQAVGPEVIDPIIIQEGAVSEKYLSQIIALHQESILQPVIIILLRDNDFTRAKALLSHAPNGTNIKMIRNDGETEICKVINVGDEDVDSFLDSFSRQCFSTCSQTRRDVLLSEQWAGNSIIKQYGPMLLKIRSCLLYDEKSSVQNSIESIIASLEIERFNGHSSDLLLALLCISKLSRVYCRDFGDNDIIVAEKIAKEINNDLLIAHVYRYAQLFPGLNRSTQAEMLTIAEGIFSQNNVEDHAIYCMNNRLITQFYCNSINVRDFHRMQEKAIFNTPGLVGMSYIYNNTGVAYLYTGDPEQAINYLIKGLDYSKERIVQRLGLMNNILISRAYMFDNITEVELLNYMNYVFDSMGVNRLPFLTANFCINAIAISLIQHPKLYSLLTRQYPIEELVRNAFLSNILGSGSLALQIGVLKSMHPEFTLSIQLPVKTSAITGIRSTFILRHAMNPTIFNAWL